MKNRRLLIGSFVVGSILCVLSAMRRHPEGHPVVPRVAPPVPSISIRARVYPGELPDGLASKLQALLTEHPSPDRSAALREILHQLGARARRKALGTLADYDPFTNEDLYLYVLDGWIEVEPKAAWTWAWQEYQPQKFDPDLEREIPQALFGPLLGHLLASGRAETAARLLETSPESPPAAASQLTVHFAAQWALDDPHAAVAGFGSIENAVVRANALRGIVDAFTRESPDQAESFAKGIRSPDDQRLVWTAMVQSLPKNNGEPAAHRFIQNLGTSLPADLARQEFVEDTLLMKGTQDDALSVLSQIKDVVALKRTTREAARLVREAKK